MFMFLETDFPRNWKTVQLDDKNFRALVHLWCWAKEHNTDDVTKIVTRPEVSQHVTGCPDLSRLGAIGFIDEVADFGKPARHILHGFWEYQRKATETYRKQNQRDRKQCHDMSRDVPSCPKLSMESRVEYINKDYVADSKKSATPPKIEFEEKHLSFADKLKDAILRVKPDHLLAKKYNQKTRESWAREMRLLEKDVGDIRLEAALRDFETAWYSKNIQSARKLREKFDDLELGIQEVKQRKQPAYQKQSCAEALPWAEQ